MSSASSFSALTLCDRAVHFLGEHGPTTEASLLDHVYGGSIPEAVRARLSAPLLADPRLERNQQGTWSLRGLAAVAEGFTTLALAATGPRPGRAGVVYISALRVESGSGDAHERFRVMLDPQRRVPRYVAERLRVETGAFEGLPRFADVLDELDRFLGERPVVAQDADLAWSFLSREARAAGRLLPDRPLIDLNELAVRRLSAKGKPSLALVAAQLGIGTTNITHPNEEARVLAAVFQQLREDGEHANRAAPAAVALRRASTAQSLPQDPGVYVLRDADQRALYVGKARRLRSRVAAYVHRPLGATRRLEGLVGSVEAVDTTRCETDLEALVLEDREIRRLEPRFNTVRQQQPPRYWIRLPPHVEKRAPPRLELSSGPTPSQTGEFIGPFRNEMLAERARLLAREVFRLHALRRGDAWLYRERLAEAWSFLKGDSRRAQELAALLSVDLLRKVVAFDIRPMLLPADPRAARYAVIRPTLEGVEGFLLHRGIFIGWTLLGADDDHFKFTQRLLAATEPRTSADDVNVVLRWFGAQRPPARLVLAADEPLAAADAIEEAALDLAAAREAGATGGKDALNPFG